MSNTLLVKVTNCHYDLGSVELDYIFGESLLALEDFIELTTSDERHDEVETKLRLEEIVHADKERMITAEQNIFL